MKRKNGEYKRSGFRPSGNSSPVPQIPYVTGLVNRVSLVEAGAKANASKRECGPDTEDFFRARQRSEVGGMPKSPNWPRSVSVNTDPKGGTWKPGLPYSLIG